MTQKLWPSLQALWRSVSTLFIAHGMKLLVILVCMGTGMYLARFIGKKVLEYFQERSDQHMISIERKKRAETLVRIFVFCCRITIIAIAVFMVLEELGIDIAPLLAGAGIVGIAIGFGAQSIVKDFFSGFFILLENQYRVGDVVKIGTLAGVVESINLRTTILRDLAGVLHIIPNGSIDRVSNMTFGWSRAVVDVNVAYTSNLDQVFSVLQEAGDELCQDPDFKNEIIEPPEVLGVDSFSDSAITIKVLIKTQPIQQWGVARAFRKQVKEAFDRSGIEIPFPQRVVYQREAGKFSTSQAPTDTSQAPTDTSSPAGADGSKTSSKSKKKSKRKKEKE